MEGARRILQAITDGSCDPYEGYRAVYAIYTGTSGIAEVLKPLFQLSGIEPDGVIHVDDEFRRAIVATASNWLKNNAVPD